MAAALAACYADAYRPGLLASPGLSLAKPSNLILVTDLTMRPTGRQVASPAVSLCPDPNLAPTDGRPRGLVCESGVTSQICGVGVTAFGVIASGPVSAPLMKARRRARLPVNGRTFSCAVPGSGY